MSSPGLSPLTLPTLRARMRDCQPIARHGVRPLGDARVDNCLMEGGLALGQLHEVGSLGVEGETGAAAAGFVACLLAGIGGRRPLVWVSPTPDLHAPGLLAFGLDPGRLVFVTTRDDDETLAAMETVLREGAAEAVVGEVARLGRIASRRLQLACLKHATTGIALRRWPWGRRGEDREATASVTRWRVLPVPSEAALREPGRPRWEVALTHSRGGVEASWIIEATGETHATHPLRVVAELGDAAAATGGLARAG